MLTNLRMPTEANNSISMSSNASNMMVSGISQAREFDDPPTLHEKTEYLLREWVNMYHSPAAGRDSTKAFTCFVQQASWVVLDKLVCSRGLPAKVFTEPGICRGN